MPKQKANPATKSRDMSTPVFPHPPSGKLRGKIALITGADSGIGRAVAVAFAREGAQVAFLYLDEHQDAEETCAQVRGHGSECLSIPGDAGDEGHCRRSVDKVARKFGGLDILVNNAAVQFPQDRIEDISAQQLERTFRTNIYSMFFMVRAALPHLKKGSVIINTTSVTAYHGHPQLMDYSATKGAIVSFTRSLAHALVEKGIRVNGVAPGPINTPLTANSSPRKNSKAPVNGPAMGRAGEPEEVAPAFVFLASQDSSYMTGQILHPNGGEIVNG